MVPDGDVASAGGRSVFDAETDVSPTGEGRWSAHLSARWNINDSANGGYALSPVVRALRDLGAHPDPLSVTTHFLRPSTGGPAEVAGTSVRRGRTTSVASGALRQDGTQRLAVLAAFGDLAAVVGLDTPITAGPPGIPPPEACVDRAVLAQGVVLPILDRLDVRLRPEHAAPGRSGDAVIEGWIRLADGSPTTVLTLPLFADAFPPSLYPMLGRIGWVPTIELTVHVRRRPAPGWVQARFECDDLAGGRMVESGSLWDADGALVARSRQLGVVMRP